MGQIYISSTNTVAMSFLNNEVFFTSGIPTVAVMSTSDITSTGDNAMGILVASTTPSSSVPTDCTLIVTWRGRLCLGGDINNPQNFYMSRLGVPTDWNYAAVDEAAAVSGNLSDSGQIGEPITAMIPFNDDLMIISTVNSIWMIEGDPAQGGSIVLLARSGGIISPNAWTISPEGQLYYVTQAGVWMVMPIWALYRPPQLVSGMHYSYFFETINPSNNEVTLEWDATNKYLRIYVTPFNGSAGMHMVYDTRNTGFWPIQYASTNGPTAAAGYLTGVGGNSQLIALGGTDGNIYQENVSNTPSTYSAYVQYQPFQLDPSGQSLLQQLEIEFGELPVTLYSGSTGSSTNSTNFAGVVTVIAGPTAADVSDFQQPAVNSTGASTTVTTFSYPYNLDRRQLIIYPRVAGEWFSVSVSTGSGIVSPFYTAIEKILVTGIPYGMNRTIR